MIQATSAGAILFRDTRGRREYLLLKSRPGDWEFPKGGVEGEEELQQTAIREVKEEAGIEDFRLLDGFREDYDYVFEANGNTIHKTVHLFIARSFEASAELSSEHRDLQWRDYEQAINTITQDGPRDIFEEAHEFIDEKLEDDDEQEDVEEDESRTENVEEDESRTENVEAGGTGGTDGSDGSDRTIENDEEDGRGAEVEATAEDGTAED